MELFRLFGSIGLNGVSEAKKDLNDVTDTAEKSSSKLNKFGGFMKGLGKAVIGTTVAVGSGAVALVKQVSGAYGQLQQSIGGIETLFGESADKVIQNANNAYTTAGISANDYMQQVTSFSASLLQALGGDTEKACDSADMAIRDMSDNANKMGTSMEMIQNAYQGFAKQNYTMLDNLKLGYGGTKTEMERLLADAQKVTGIKYDISNLNDVYQAIHVIQGELGITGTTAKESGETIEGSFNSLSASWQNFIAGLGNPDADMKQLVDNLAKSISGAVNNITPIINNMVQVLPTVMDALIGAVSSMLPTLIQTFTELITKVIDAIIKLLPEFIPLAVDCILTVVQALLENLPLIINAGIQLILGLAQGISDALPQLTPIIVMVIQEIINLVINNLPLIIQIGTELLLAVITGLMEAIPTLYSLVPDIISNLVMAFMDSIPLLFKAGADLIGAFFNGILNAFGKFKLPRLKLTGSLNPMDWLKGNLPRLGVEWYAKGGILTKPTVFGYNPTTGNAMVGGEAGKEAIAPISTLQTYVSDAVRKETSDLSYGLNKLIDLLATYLPDIKEKMDRPLVLDSGAIVGGIATKMDAELGNISNRKARFGV